MRFVQEDVLMFRRMTYVAGLVFLTQITHAVASDETPVAASQALPYYLVKGPEAKMEKCFGLSDAKPKECAMASDSDSCKAAQERPKDGTEFTYVPRGTCAKRGGQMTMPIRLRQQK
jgi:uncharacterized membrane protein